MSHELRTPLNSIIGYSELLIDEMGPSMDEMSFEDLKAIHSSGQHLLSIINDILDLAKIEAGRLELNRTKVDFVGLAGQVTESARVLLKDKPEVELEMDIPADLPPIEADSVRLRQVLWNLLSNAIKFTEQGSVELLAVVEDNTLRVAVKDTGIGIAPQYQTLIFDQFRQADGSTTRRAGGTGLGLAITRQLVLLHGGDIQVESVLGKGSTFIVTLPLTPPRHHRARDTGELTSPVETEAAEAPGD
jgi:signal transduction histidine kinase